MNIHENPSIGIPFWLAAAAGHGSDSTKGQGDDADKQAQPLRILIVEDEFFISLHTKQLLQAIGHDVVAIAVSADQAVEAAAREMPDLVLMDIRLAGPRDGIEAAEEIQRRFGISSIFVTANTDPQTRRRAEAAKPIAILEKPLTEHRLRQGLAALP